MSNFYICEYFYPGNDEPTVKLWWGLKQNIYNIIIAIVFVLPLIKGKTRYFKAIVVFGIIMCAGNVIDRLFFDIKTFQLNDAVLIFLGLIVSTLIIIKTNARTVKASAR